MFESGNEKLLSKALFYKRIILCLFSALIILFTALGIGVLGYHFFADLGWIDSLLNASMILTGMGPVDILKSDGAKVFASCYAIFSGVIFISIIGVVLSPIFHRMMHKIHLDDVDIN